MPNRERVSNHVGSQGNDGRVRGMTARAWAVLPLRLVLGTGFLVHGLAKLQRGPAGFARLLEQLAVPAPLLAAWSVTLLEILGGAAILVGFGIALVALPLVCTLVVAAVKVHLRYGFSAVNTVGLTATGPVFGPPGYEVDLLYIAGLVALVWLGPGPLSVATMRGRRSRERA